MTDKELRHLSRGELLEMLIDQSTELQALREKLEAAEAALKKRDITIGTAGSIAEAALQLNGVFEAAQKACQQYTDNIRQLSQRQQEICDQLEAESQARAKKIIEDAEKKKADMEYAVTAQCAEMVAKAKAEAKAYWDDVSRKLEAFSSEHAELQQLLSVAVKKQ